MRKTSLWKLNIKTVDMLGAHMSGTLSCRLCFEEMSQWSQSLERLLSSKCKLISAIFKSTFSPTLMEELTVPCLSDMLRWYEDIPGLLEVWVQWWKHWVLAGVWGLQEDQVFIQDVLQGQKDLQTLYSSRSCERGMSRDSFHKTLNATFFFRSPLTVHPLQINIDHKTRDVIRQNIEAPTKVCFDDAQTIVYSLMERDSYPRFLKSDFYQALMDSTSESLTT